MEEQALYDKYKAGRHWDQHTTAHAIWFADYLKQQDFTGLLIDIGCGSGRDTNVFRREGLDAVGIDISELEVRLAQERFPRCRFEVQDAERLNFSDDSIGAAYMANVIHYLKKRETLREVHRILKPGGYLFVQFNTTIIDNQGKVDYHHDENDIMNLVPDFKLLARGAFDRVDMLPCRHTHNILELLLKK